MYSITGSVIIKDNKKNNSVSTGLADLEDLGFYSSTNNFDNEVEVLHSRTLLKKSSGGTGPVYQLQNP